VKKIKDFFPHVMQTLYTQGSKDMKISLNWRKISLRSIVTQENSARRFAHQKNKTKQNKTKNFSLLKISPSGPSCSQGG